MFINRTSNFLGNFVCILVVLVPLFYACSSDSGSSTGNDEEPVNLNSSSSSRPSSSGAVTEAEDFDISKFEQEKDGTVKGVDDKTYSTVAVGPVTWIAENLNSVSALEVKSTCYNYDEDNCDSYGRFYMDNDYSSADAVCPEGYTLPSIGAWNNLLKSGEKFEPVFAGICSKGDSLRCEGLNTKVRYLVDDDQAIVFTKDSSGKISHAFEYRYDNYFYSLRCVKYRTIVNSFKDLPYCDEDYGNMPSIYVADKDSSYYCSQSYYEWLPDGDGRYCRSSEKGDFFLTDSALLKCNGERWRLADIFDVDEPCTEKTLYKEYVMNGNRFACTEDGWVKLSYPSSILGYCHEEVEGSIGYADSTHTYICEDGSWRVAYVNEVFGKCSTNVVDKVIEFNMRKYICMDSSWFEETTVDSALGFCTTDLRDSAKIYGNSHYLCTKNGWSYVESWDYLGNCDSTTMWDSVMVGTQVYMCNGNLVWQTQYYSDKIGLCTEENRGTVKKLDSYSYICKKPRLWEWKSASAIEVLFGGCEFEKDYRTIVTDSVIYECDRYGWDSRDAVLSDFIGTCTSKTGTVTDTVYKGVEYICDTTANTNGWFTPTALDSAYGYCRTALLGEVKPLSDTTEAVCEKYSSYKKQWTIREVVIEIPPEEE